MLGPGNWTVPARPGEIELSHRFIPTLVLFKILKHFMCSPPLNHTDVPVHGMSIDIEKEDRRLRARLHRNGAYTTANYVAGLIRSGKYPLWHSHQFIDYLLKKGETQAAEIVLLAIKRSGEKHFLIDDLNARWLWSMGDRSKALQFTKKKAKYWSHSCLYNTLYAMYKLLGKQAQSDRCDQISEQLALSELARANNKK